MTNLKAVFRMLVSIYKLDKIFATRPSPQLNLKVAY